MIYSRGRFLTGSSYAAAALGFWLGLAVPEASAQGNLQPPDLPGGVQPPIGPPAPSGTTRPGESRLQGPGLGGTAGEPFTGSPRIPGATGSWAGTGANANAAGGGSDNAAAVGGGLVSAAPGGYIDNAVPITTFRLRYDSAYGINRPDRAEYFYGTWHELGFHPHGIQGQNKAFFDPSARGPDNSPASLDSQEPSAYAEYAIDDRFSVFADVPLRYLHFGDSLEEGADRRFPMRNGRFFPEPNRGRSETDFTNTGGLSDVQLGFKAALLAAPDQYLTFQFRTYLPTGNTSQGLGTGHVSLEPSLLYFQRLTGVSDRLVLLGQLTDWIPIDGGPMQGNIFQYGAGVAYDVYRSGQFRITPVTEFVGWTILDGYESIFSGSGFATSQLDLPPTHGVRDASGDTIINAKFGVRTFFDDNNSLYIGYGHSLTGDRWYKDVLRAEYRMTF